MSWWTRYAHWLHTQWPAGRVEKLPELDELGRTNIPGVYVVGDLKGIPLLKFSVDSGTRAVQHIAAELKDVVRGPWSVDRQDTSVHGSPSTVHDLIIIGGGVSGMAAALEARTQGLSYKILEASEPFSTIINFPKAKPIYTYPKDMTPAGRLKVTAEVKEPLVEELRAQTRDIETIPVFAQKIERQGDLLKVIVSQGQIPPNPPLQKGGVRGDLLARRVIVAIGRSGNFRLLKVPGENLDKVYNRLHDPKDFADKEVLVVGGGDTAMETVIALVYAGARVTLSYRQKEFSRAKPENIEQVMRLAQDPMSNVSVSAPTSERITTAVDDYMGMDRKKGSLKLMWGSAVQEIRPENVLIKDDKGQVQTLKNDVVFTMIGRDAPLDFFQRSGIRITNEWTPGRIAACASFVVFALALYNWKSGGMLSDLFYRRHWFPTNLADLLKSSSPAAVSGGSMGSPLTTGGNDNLGGLFKVLIISASGPSFWYTLAYSVLVVTFGIKRIRRRKTPYITAQTLTLMSMQVLPLFLLPEIILPWLGHNNLIPVKLADALFPVVTYGHGREYWRAYGFILAWPLMVYNVFTSKPMFWWLVISFIQTFVLIPGMIYFWGKGAYCGWICSCGALAETLGDTHRTKMPHGPKWNKLNMVGQVILTLAFLLLGVRIFGWIFPNTRSNWMFDGWVLHNYKWFVDVGLAGVVGYGVYFWYSGRFWCRFFCPLAALMHIYSRFSRFRILSEKKKCISCNVCTSVCHQGIDVMNFANKGLPMRDPECVRCSACVQSCPTGVLTFGQVDKIGNVIKKDSLAASPVLINKE